MSIYLDNAATTPVCAEAVKAAVDAMSGECGNPSSLHAAGRDAKKILEESRAETARALGCKSGELYFTSGGSESDNWAIFRAAEYNRRVGKHIISSPCEHDAVLQPLSALASRGYEVTLLKPEKDGSISPDRVAEALRDDTCLVSLMLVNNETGAITDIAAVADIIKKSGSRALLHTDAVQGFMKIPFGASSLGADIISVSGHKIHAPKGIGALYIRSGLNLPPYILGGGQESGRRAGTEPVPQISAFAAAVRAASKNFKDDFERMSALRAQTAERLSAENDGLVVIGGGAPHILCFSMPGYRSEVIMNFLDGEGIYVSRSSACKRGRRSHVLEAIGLDSAVIDGAVRVSLSRYTSEAELDALCRAIYDAARRLRTSRRP